MKIKRAIVRMSVVLEKARWFVLGAILLRFFLEISYIKFVNPLYEYEGFYIDFNAMKYTESWLVYILLIITSPKILMRVSDFLMVTIILSFILPLLIFYGMSDQPREHLYLVLLCVTLIFIFRNGHLISLPTVIGGRIISVVVLWLGTIGVTAWMIYSGGLSFFNLNILRVYEFRHEVGTVINEGIMAYLNTWAPKVFGPLLLAISLWKKNYLVAAMIFFLHIFWFGISSHRAVLFYPLVISFIWLWFRTSRALALMSLGMSAAIAVSLSAFLIFDYTVLGGLFIWRVFFVPSFFTFVYYDFFSHNPFVYWSNNITASFIIYPYEASMQPDRVIGDYLGTGTHANNSFLSTGYMHAGILGVIFYGIIAGLLFRFIDSVASRGIPPWLGLTAIIIPSKAFIVSSDLPTSLLTHGMGIAILLLFLYRSKGQEYQVHKPIKRDQAMGSKCLLSR